MKIFIIVLKMVAYLWLFVCAWAAISTSDQLVPLLFATPVAGLLWKQKRNEKEREDWELEISNRSGAMPRFNYFSNSSGIALNEKNRELILHKKGLTKFYSYEDIRSWTIKEETANTVSVGPGVGSISAALANSSARANAANNTGFYIYVKDIDHPEWRIPMFSSADRSRWFEILNQTVNEGGAA